MKKIFSTALAICAALLTLAKTPGLISYQAVVRNAQNQLIHNAPVSVQISILQGVATGTPVYI